MYKKKTNQSKQSAPQDFKLGRFDSIPGISVAMAIRHMSIMLRSGISLHKTLTIMTKQAENPLLRKVFEAIEHHVGNGVSLASSMQKFPKVFSPIVVSIIEIGEQGGGLDQNLLFLTDYLKKKHDLNKKIQGALLYPLIVFGITLLEMAGVIFFVLPQVEALFLLFKDIPGYVVVIMAVAGFLRVNWYWLLLGTTVLGGLALWYFSTAKGKQNLGKIQLKTPIVKKVVKLQVLTSVARTVGILMTNGIPLVRAIRITAETTNNSVYKKILLLVAKDADGGKPLAQSLKENSHYFPATFISLIELGESSGALEENFRYLNGFYSEELEELTSNMSSLIEPIMLIFIGAMIGMLAITIIGPIYSLTSSIN